MKKFLMFGWNGDLIIKKQLNLFGINHLKNKQFMRSYIKVKLGTY